jgi:hypothetical protein
MTKEQLDAICEYVDGRRRRPQFQRVEELRCVAAQRGVAVGDEVQEVECSG